jgi:YD repeat-containing protein
VFTALMFQPQEGDAVDLLARNADLPEELVPRGPVYLVPVDAPDGGWLEPYRDYFRATLALEVTVLPPIAIEPDAFDTQREQAIAESLVDSMRRQLPEIEGDATATVIGVTTHDMYIAGLPWSFAFSFRKDDRFGIVSTARMVPAFRALWPRDGLLATRLRKMLTKNLGLLAYRLPLSDDPTSVLYRGILGTADLDLVEERFQGRGRQAVVSPTVVTHRASPIQAEIRRAESSPGEPVDVSYPCFVVSSLVSQKGVEQRPALTTCTPGMRTERVFDELEVDLRSGLLITRKTDIFAPDDIPLALTRSHRNWDRISRAFGIGGNHPYDILPVGTRRPYTYLDLILADGTAIHFPRVSEGTGYADAVYEHSANTAFLGSAISWNGNGWTLRFADGGQFLFPENYAGVRPNQGALIEMQDAAGRRVRFERDRDRALQRLTSPAGHVITFEYDETYRVTRATDGAGRDLGYEYDAGGRLAAVRDGDGRVRYVYDGTLLTEVSTGDERETLLRVAYDRRRVALVELSDRRSYRFRFSFSAPEDQQPSHVDVQGSDGLATSLSIQPPR